MVTRDELTAYLDGYLSVDKIKDDSINGLQVEGKPEVTRIVTSVSISEKLIRKAAAVKADMIIVHHGLLWKGSDPVVRGSFAKRVRALQENGITLLGYHLPLDCHPTLGNNMLSAKGLGLSSIRSFGSYHNVPIGFCGAFKRPITPDELLKRVNRFYGAKATLLKNGPDQIRSVGIVTGGAARMVKDAVRLGLDAFVTGEMGEPSLHESSEEGIHFVAAGHYLTERCGIQALGRHITSRLKVQVEHIDFPVPV